ncbi:MAG: aldehyde:ferredoxin oxidoreductase [Sedimentibacter sp.]|jgi:aldehyde:ferredoxin oxidoreductase|nr:aldehyde:ferredoxin oxidoreductase [Sedimentibacter sp.]
MQVKSINALELSRKLLRVNLTTGKITSEVLDEEIIKQYIGGAGLGYKLLFDMVTKDIEPFDAENPIILTTGLATGTTIPGTSLFNICTKGPITNLSVSAQANGYFGLRLKQSGYSTVVIEGKSEGWKYLSIENGTAVLKDAEHLVGKNSLEAEILMKEELGEKNSSAMTIGIGGENLVRFANVQSDGGHFASSNGPGAVMGSKKLKGIIVYGDYKVEAAKHDEFIEAVKEYNKLILDAPPAKGLSQLGTGMLIPIAYKIGYLPIRNLSEYNFPQYVDFDAAVVKKNPSFEFKKNSCYACPIGHCRDMIFKEGPYEGRVVDEPEYEGWQAFSGLIGVTDVAEAAMLNRLNDELGLDLKEMGYTLAWAIECYEKGYLTKEETDGLELNWGNVSSIRNLMMKIARREGFGNKLAEGVMRASKMYSDAAADCAVYCKRGSAPHIHDPRGNYSVAIGQLISENGSIWGEANRAPNPEFGYCENVPYTEVKAHPVLVARGAPKVAFRDCFMICNFVGFSIPHMMKCLNALTGWNMNEDDAITVGKRMITLARAFNILQGAAAEDDNLSKRLLDTVQDGPNKGKAIGPHVEEIKRRYYKELGWNEETSYPLPETLSILNLEFAAEKLYDTSTAK